MLYERENIEWSNFWWEEANKECKRLLLIGDSVTRGYRSALNDFMSEFGGHIVDLCAFSATITDEMTGKMLDVFFSFDDYKYDVIGIQLGGQHGFKKKCCMDLEYRNLWKQNYLRYVSEINRKCDNIFLISYTPTVLKENLETDNVERNEELACRNEIAREVAEEIGCPYIDLWDWILDKKYKHTDYIHFDKEANQQIADYMGREIVNKLRID